MFPRNYYISKKYSDHIDAYRTLVKEFAAALGAGTDVEKQADSIVNFEVELAKVIPSDCYANYICVTFTY